MKFLLLNQTFYPDVVATAQVLTDLAVALVKAGHQVTVICSQRAYDDPTKVFPAYETRSGIEIHRIHSTGFGKGAKWKRGADFASFLLVCLWKLFTLQRHDAVIALTSPPLISVLGALRARLWRGRFYYWIMDLNPDEAIAAGWLKANSYAARFLDALSRYSLCRADKVIVLDRFMEERIAAKDISRDKIEVISPWSHDDDVRYDEAGRNTFRARHGLVNKFVVMYSGNHSPCHPLDSLLSAAEKLRENAGIVFCFVGGGSEWRKIQNSKLHRASANILCLPYQPLDQLSASLSAADLHVVVMGEGFVGTIHPCKIYNAMKVAPAILYIGPEKSHVTDIFCHSTSSAFAAVRSNDPTTIVEEIQRLRSSSLRPSEFSSLANSFSKNQLLPQLVSLLESSLPSTKSP